MAGVPILNTLEALPAVSQEDAAVSVSAGFVALSAGIVMLGFDGVFAGLDLASATLDSALGPVRPPLSWHRLPGRGRWVRP